MKKIANDVYAISMLSAVRKAIFGSEYATGGRYDVYAEDDGTIRVCKHKISFEEAERMAENWLDTNDAFYSCNDKGLSYMDPTSRIIVCAYVPTDKNDVKVGAAKCKDGDRYSYIVGKALAYSRATGKKLPSELAEYLGIQQ